MSHVELDFLVRAYCGFGRVPESELLAVVVVELFTHRTVAVDQPTASEN